MTEFKKRLRIVEMPGVSLVGTLCETMDGGNTARLEHPCILVRTSETNINLVNMLKNGIYDGTFIEINMKAITWTGMPSKQISSAYQAQCVGLIPAVNLEGAKLNG